MKVINDKQLRIIGPFFLFVGGTLFFRLDWYFEQPVEKLIRSDFIGLGAGYICWNLNRWVILQLQQRNPGLNNTRKRLLLVALLMPFLVNFAWLIRQLGHMAFNNATQMTQSIPNYTYSVGIQIFYHFIYFVIYEGAYILQAWRKAFEQNERLKVEKLKHQLDTLKSQINPHFLFNSLNSLSMLIHDNPQQAEAVVDEISSVYRYLLRANDYELTTLSRELDFIKSYMHLLKTRYGAGFDLRIDIDEATLNHKIPPLTLQLLIENAVKHNVILPENPLVVEITTSGQSLLVQNNLQRKNASVLSNKVGLANIATKYRLLGGFKIAIREEAGRFAVTLPLLVNVPETERML